MIKSIRTKLILLFGAILASVILLQISFNLFFAEEFYIYQKSNVINSAYKDVSENYSDNQEKLYEILKKYEESGNLIAVILNEDGEVNYSTIHNWKFNRKAPRPPADFIRDSIYKKGAKATIQKNPITNQQDLLLSGIIEKDGLVRYILIDSPISSIEQTVKTTNLLTLYISIFILIIGSLAVYIFSKRITNPIKEIDNIAKSVANLDFSKRAENNGNDEIAHLSQNINIMSDKLSFMINELKIANEELEKDNIYKTKIDIIRKEFVANVSHELKTPISLLIGYSEMLKTNIPGIDKDFYYDVIIDESHKMNKLVSNLLDVSNLENGLTTLHLEMVNLPELLSWIIEKNKMLFFGKQYDVKCDDCIIKCDRLKIEQAMTNYIINAINHTDDGKLINISIKKLDKGMIFRIFNEGDIIADKDIKKIWNSFYKADESRTDRSSTGLGLYIVSTIINAHNGEYGVKNKKNGVEFWFTLNEI